MYVYICKYIYMYIFTYVQFFCWFWGVAWRESPRPPAQRLSSVLGQGLLFWLFKGDIDRVPLKGIMDIDIKVPRKYVGSSCTDLLVEFIQRPY